MTGKTEVRKVVTTYDCSTNKESVTSVGFTEAVSSVLRWPFSCSLRKDVQNCIPLVLGDLSVPAMELVPTPRQLLNRTGLKGSRSTRNTYRLNIIIKDGRPQQSYLKFSALESMFHGLMRLVRPGGRLFINMKLNLLDNIDLSI
jgi:hypothetical protein